MYLFNPDNDLALANFSPHYTPPVSALNIAKDLALLPVWYASNGEKIIVEGEENEKFLSGLKEKFAIENTLISFFDIAQFPQEKIIPWGWNPVLRKRLTAVGVHEENLPSIDDLKLLRQYSSRQNAVKMLHELQENREGFCGESYFFDNVTDLLDYLSTEIYSVLKMPNSGSGKGLVWIKGNITDKQTDWANRVIREQGGVVAEPVLNKTQDFAMEFFAKNGKTDFSGYSLFKSADSGAYMGNFLLSDKKIEEELTKYISLETISWIKDFYLKKLPEYFPHYNGYIGVDMMICEASNEYKVQPCVEINLRMNMGMAARIFHDRFVHLNSSGRFVVDFFKKQGEALAYQQKMQNDFPLVINAGKIVSGFLNLTPALEETKYMVWVLINNRTSVFPLA
ncbi:MAG: hypothetical protein Q4G63_00715 [Bacteroidia bacterium]|nr:hypothetical protein [Bacteroidia bacterium]